MRLKEFEKKALKEVFKDFKGEIFLFGSRLDESKKGGDIDILVKTERSLSLEEILKLEGKYFLLTDTSIDIVQYDEKNPFIQEIMKNAKRLDVSSL